MTIITAIKRFLRDEQGLTVVEYVVGAAGVVTMLALFFSNYGETLSSKMGDTLS